MGIGCLQKSLFSLVVGSCCGLLGACGGAGKLDSIGQLDPMTPQGGGQSGVEGGCSPESATKSPLADDQVAPRLGFRPADIRALAEGVHSTTVRWGTLQPQASAEIAPTLKVDIQAVGDAMLWTGCGDYLELSGSLSLRSSDGTLVLETPAQMVARTAELVVIDASVPRSAMPEWNGRLEPVLNQQTEDVYRISLHVTKDSVRGEFVLVAMGGSGASCELAVWPKERRCRLTSREHPIAHSIRGVDVNTLVAGLNTLGPQDLNWEQGTITSVSARFELEGGSFCEEEAIRDMNGNPTDSVLLTLPLRTHLWTTDGNLDLWTAAELSLGVTTNGEHDGGRIDGDSLAFAGERTATAHGITAPDRPRIHLQAWPNANDWRGKIDIWKLSPKSPELLADELRGSCASDTGRAGSLVSIARGTW